MERRLIHRRTWHWLHRIHLMAVLGQLLYAFCIPICILALAVAGPVVGSMLLLGSLIVLQYPVYRGLAKFVDDGGGREPGWFRCSCSESQFPAPTASTACLRQRLAAKPILTND